MLNKNEIADALRISDLIMSNTPKLSRKRHGLKVQLAVLRHAEYLKEAFGKVDSLKLAKGAGLEVKNW